MDSLTVTPEVLREKATGIRNKVKDMDEILNKITTEFDRVPDSYVGQSANAIMDKYNTLKTKYDKFIESMTSYAEFLEKTATTYAELSARLAQKANNSLAD